MKRGLRLATLAYVRKNGRTLMLHRNRKPDDYHFGKWNGLGGKFEAGESPEQCLKREVLEESGLHALSWHLNGFLTFPTFDGTNDWYVFVFTITDFAGKLIESPEGELHWIDDAQLLELNLWPGDRLFLPWLEQPQLFSAVIEYDGPEVSSHQVSFYPGS